MFRTQLRPLTILGAVCAATTASRLQVATLTLSAANFRFRNKGNDET